MNKLEFTAGIFSGPYVLLLVSEKFCTLFKSKSPAKKVRINHVKERNNSPKIDIALLTEN